LFSIGRRGLDEPWPSLLSTARARLVTKAACRRSNPGPCSRSRAPDPDPECRPRVQAQRPNPESRPEANPGRNQGDIAHQATLETGQQQRRLTSRGAPSRPDGPGSHICPIAVASPGEGVDDQAWRRAVGPDGDDVEMLPLSRSSPRVREISAQSLRSPDPGDFLGLMLHQEGIPSALGAVAEHGCTWRTSTPQRAAPIAGRRPVS
jgi:hypothetical protein